MSEHSITIKDIANLAKVSTATVSRYLSDKNIGISEEKRKRIQEAIDRTNYEPNVTARNLRSRKTKAVGIILSNFYGVATKELLGGCCEVFTKAGYTTMIFDSGDTAESERRCLLNCAEQVDGIIFRPISRDFRLYDQVLLRGTPVVLFDRYWPSWQHDAVFLNNYDAAYKMLEHLYSNGYRDLYYWETPGNEANTKHLRKQAYIDFMYKSFGNNFHPEQLILSSGLNDDNAYLKMIESILSQERIMGPKALFYDSQSVFLLLPHIIKMLEIKIPEQLAICGYESESWADFITPSITAIPLPQYEMAKKASELLLRRMNEQAEGNYNPSTGEVVKIGLDINPVFRDSTRKAIW